MSLSTRSHSLHDQALALTNKAVLKRSEREFILEHFNEGAKHNNGTAGAFFTPWALAMQFPIYSDLPSSASRKVRILDLCAGIGALAYYVNEAYDPKIHGGHGCEIVCVECNPDYVAVGEKVVPNAEWINMDVNDISKLLSLGKFDFVMANPPFGAVSTFKGAKKINYTGSDAAFKVIELASLMAESANFIFPQRHCGFVYSGVNSFTPKRSTVLESFTNQTGIRLKQTNFSGTDEYQSDWKSNVPPVEFVSADFSQSKTYCRIFS